MKKKYEHPRWKLKIRSAEWLMASIEGFTDDNFDDKWWEDIGGLGQ